MAKFGGNEFTNFSVPLVFRGRYFILEPTNPPLLTVFMEVNGQPIFEILKNQPMSNTMSTISVSGAGVITVSERQTNQFLYKIRPASTTSVVFGTLKGEENSVLITDKEIKIGGTSVTNCVFDGGMVGVQVREDGGISMGAKLPSAVAQLLKR